VTYKQRAAITETVKVEMSGGAGSVEVDGLRAARTVGVPDPGTLTPGQPVVLEWLPRTDVWPSRTFDEEVRFVGADGTRVTVRAPDLRVADGRFHFVVPSLPPGKVSLSLSAGPQGPQSGLRCRGFAGCRTGEFGVTDLIAVQVNTPAPKAPP